MSKFLKLKGKHTGKRVLVKASEVAAVFEDDDGCTVSIASTGEEIDVKEGYQTLVNRLTKGEEAEAEVTA